MECVRSGVLDPQCSGRSFGSTTACGKVSFSSNLAGSTKFEQKLHGKVKPLLLAASGKSSLILRGPVLKHQHSLAVRSTPAVVCTTFDENVKGVSSHAVEDKVGVLLLNLGGPETLNDVQPFLFNLFADTDIIRLPRLFRFLQRPLAKLISAFRAPKSKEGYASIGGGSPLRRITDEQIALKEKNLEADIYIGMRYWYPFTEEAIDQIKQECRIRLRSLLFFHYTPSTPYQQVGQASVFSKPLSRKIHILLVCQFPLLNHGTSGRAM